MKTSETITKIVDALCRAQGSFDPVVKNRENPFFKSKYADLTACFDATTKHLAANGLAKSQGMVKVEGERVCVTRIMHTSGEWIETETPIVGNFPNMQALGSGLTYGRRYGYQGIVGINAEDDDDGNAAAKPEGDKKPATNEPKPPQWDTGFFPGDNAENFNFDDIEYDKTKKPHVPPKEENKTPPVKPKQTGLVTEAQLKRLYAISNAKGWTNDQCKLYMTAAWSIESSKDLDREKYDTLIAVIEAGNYVSAIGKLKVVNMK